MRVVLCWTGISGYAAACWRALSARKDISLKVIAFDGGGKNTSFGRETVNGVKCHLLSPAEAQDSPRVRNLVTAAEPDVIVLSGWFHRPYTELVFDSKLRRVRCLMGLDTPWLGTLRQRLAKYALRQLLHRLDGVIVAGERAWQYARKLGIPEGQVYRGVYGHDAEAFATAANSRSDEWPRRFLFTGRYVDEKGIDILLEAYRKYRQELADPWSLTCCGQGPLDVQIRARDGVFDRGFVQPRELPRVMAEHGAFILPSRYEPWGVVLAEAASAGLPLLCSEACGASVELVRSCYNGLTVATGCAGALAQAMAWFHVRRNELAQMGKRSQQLAAPYSAEQWAIRWERILSSGSGDNSDQKSDHRPIHAS